MARTVDGSESEQLIEERGDGVERTGLGCNVWLGGRGVVTECSLYRDTTLSEAGLSMEGG